MICAALASTAFSTRSVAAELSFFRIDPESADVLIPDGAQKPLPKTLADFANIFYNNCLSANQDESLNEYVKTQCGCAAAKMPEALTLDQAQRLFNLVPGASIKYPYSRFVMLAYMPCMQTTLRDIVFDNCLTSPANVRIYYKRSVCKCMGNGIQDFVSKSGEYLFPGYGYDGFDPEQAVDNPIAWALKNKGLEIQTEYYYTTCVYNKESGR